MSMKGHISLPAIAVVAVGLILGGIAFNYVGGAFGQAGMGNLALSIGIVIVAIVVIFFILAFVVNREQ